MTRLLSASWLGVVLGAVTLGTAAAASGQEKPILDNVRRIVFLGDSITYGGTYIAYIEAYLATRLPERQFELVNLGLPSETVSGLSEPGHAGGQFPRPCLHERLDRVLAKTKPDLVVACYGMNDGIYYPFGEDRFRKFQEGIVRLADRVAAAKAALVLVTPPTFDPVPLGGRTLPLGKDEYRQPYEGYDDVLGRYADWLLEKRKAGWQVAHLHGPMAAHLAIRRRQTPAYCLAGDGVHAGAVGHWLMAQQVLLAWGAPAEVDAAVIDAKAMKAARGRVTDLAAEGGAVGFTWLTRRPMPMDPQWDAECLRLERITERLNRHRLVVTGLAAERYDLLENSSPVGTLTRGELAAGVDLTRLSKLSTNRSGAELLKRIVDRQRMLTDAWLTDVGHRRPGMAKGLPLDKALKQAAEMDPAIRQLAAPVPLKLRLVPA
jgi:lysophospholipase L1-like esterase